jgi:hypothetical protein
MRTALLALAITASATSAALATMPPLTEQPKGFSAEACRSWASRQDEDALYMWGMQDNGKSSRDVAILRLSLNCLGDPKPEIVGFGSSAGFDQAYCRRHKSAEICRSQR